MGKYLDFGDVVVGPAPTYRHFIYANRHIWWHMEEGACVSRIWYISLYTPVPKDVYE
jgi:hypothetical protein